MTGAFFILLIVVILSTPWLANCVPRLLKNLDILEPLENLESLEILEKSSLSRSPLILLLLLIEHDIPRIGEEAHRLPQYQHGVEAEGAIAHDDGATHQTDNPESHGQYRLLPAVAVFPLIDEAQREDDLSG